MTELFVLTGKKWEVIQTYYDAIGKYLITLFLAQLLVSVKTGKAQQAYFVAQKT